MSNYWENVGFSFVAEGYVQYDTFKVSEEYLQGYHTQQRVGGTLSPVVTTQTYPESFYRDWATFVTATDVVDKGYDPGSYGGGAPVFSRTIVVPVVKPVTLMYMKKGLSTKEQTSLVQFDGSIADAIAAGILGGTVANPTRTFFTGQEYLEAFPPIGFIRYGDVLPTGVSKSSVSELASFNGDFDTASGSVTGVQLYLQPIYLNNALPMFDYIYMAAGFRGDLDPNVSGISGHLLRWRGGIPSENIAAINRSGDALPSGANLAGYDSSPKVGLTENGVAYENTDAYNVVNLERQ